MTIEDYIKCDDWGDKGQFPPYHADPILLQRVRSLMYRHPAGVAVFNMKFNITVHAANSVGKLGSGVMYSYF